MKRKKILYYLFLLLVGFFGLNDVVNAVDTIGSGSSVTIDTDEEFNRVYLDDSLLGSDKGVHVFQKKLTNGELVYCSDGTRGDVGGGFGEQTWDYSKEADNSLALSYIFEHGYYNKGNSYSKTEYLTGDSKKDYLITSFAVWYYTIPGRVFEDFNLNNGTYGGIESEASQKTAKLIKDAGNSSLYSKPSLEVKLDNKKMSITNDGNYYISDVITLSGKEINGNVSTSVTGTSGAFVTSYADSTTGSNSFAPNSKVYIKVPVSSFSKNTSITLTATASGKTGSVHIWEYAGENNGVQSIATYHPTITSVKSEVTVTASKGSVTISKQDVTNGSEVPGAHLVLKNSKGVVVAEWTSNKTAKVLTLDPGVYILEETIAPKGYIKSTEKVTFELKNDGKVYIDGKIVDKVVMTNKPIKVVISKTDITGKNELEGASLRVTNKNGEVVTSTDGKKLEWVSGKGSISFSLPSGTYILEETIAPKGYIMSTEKITFVVDGNGKVKVDNTLVDKVIMKNEPIMVSISKTDITGKKEIPGATLRILDEAGNVVTDMDNKKLEWISTSEPVKFHLPAGTYALEETIAPKGYIKSTEKITFIVGEDGKVKVDNALVNKVTMKNKPIKVMVSKTDLTGKKELKGAKLRIVDKSGNVVKDINGKKLEWTSTTEAKELHLAAGTYTLIEVSAPKGYELSDKSIEFTIKEDGSLYIDNKLVENNKIIFKNTPEPVSVETGDSIVYIAVILGAVAIGITIFLIYKRKE